MDQPRENREGDYPCLHCEKKFGTIERLVQHTEGAHGAPRYECQHCAQKFQWRAALHRHKKKCPFIINVISPEPP